MSFAGGHWKAIFGVLAVSVLGLGLPFSIIARAADNLPVRKPLSEDEQLRKRILESLAGVRDPKAPKQQTLHGPELSDREKVIHVLGRLGFGPKPGEIDEVLKRGGWQTWVKEQMDLGKIDDATCDRVIGQKFPWSKMNMSQLQKEFDGDNQNIRQLHRDLPEYVITRAALSNRQFYELMCDFWRPSGMDKREASMRLFAEEVMPHFRARAHAAAE